MELSTAKKEAKSSTGNDNKDDRDDVEMGKFLEHTLADSSTPAAQDEHGVDETKKKSNSTTKKRHARFSGPRNVLLSNIPKERKEKVVGLKDGAAMWSSTKSQASWGAARRKEFLDATSTRTVFVTTEDKELLARTLQMRNPFCLLFLGNLSALKVMLFYLISLETILICAITAGLTVYWYNVGTENSAWQGGGMDYIILAFAVTSPVSCALIAIDT